MKNFIILLFAFILGGFNMSLAQCSKTIAPAAPCVQEKNFDYLLGTLNGLSDCLLKQHFTLYHGYIEGLNAVDSKLETCPPKTGGAIYSDYRALNIARPFANNGVILHELYFSNLTCKKTCPSQILAGYINRDFGSYENYISDIKEAAKSTRSGWVITAFNTRDCKIHNYIIDLHDEHVPVGTIPIMVLDMWEHAYTLDYGIDKKAYVEAFLKNLDWCAVSNRLENAIKE